MVLGLRVQGAGFKLNRVQGGGSGVRALGVFESKKDVGVSENKGP